MSEINKQSILVLMSTYNGEKYIDEQIESILSQQGCKPDILIRDDGSSDTTPSIIKRYAEKYDRITIISDGDNLGPAKSFWKLLMMAPNYDYYAFADQDDIWDYDKLLWGINSIKNKQGPALYCSNLRLANEKGQDMHLLAHNGKVYLNFETVLCVGQFTGCTMVFNKELAKYCKSVENPRVMTMHDHYITSICVIVGGDIIYDNSPHILYRQHTNNTIGIRTTDIDKIKYRFEYIFKRNNVLLCEQAQEWMRLYGNYIKNGEKSFLNLLIGTKNNLFCRIKLCFCNKIHYTSMNLSIMNRMAFLLGNK